MHKLQDLKIWTKAINLATEIYKATANFPNEEKYGLTSQIKRSAISISSNIAEGAGRNSSGEFLQFLGISNGSAYELQTQLIITGQLNLIDSKTLASLLKEIEELQKMNYKLQQSIKLNK
jgi:four helix bundle protein